MKIVIPMSGLGSRFVREGYKDPKPLIPIYGKPLIEWVLKMFPGEQDILFICRDEHLENTPMKSILNKIAPTGKVLGIEGHKKGPVYAVVKAFEHIPDNEPILVSYCDYYMHWNYSEFKKIVLEKDYDGAIPCYTHFHPHLIPKKNLYASCKVDSESLLQEIREKHSFTSNKELSLHSPGVYYFKNGEIVKKYFHRMISDDVSLNGEYYASLVYNLMLEDQLKVWCPDNVSHFCQWGTPEDMHDFQFWTQKIRTHK